MIRAFLLRKKKRKYGLPQLFISLLALILAFSSLSISALAAWDGYGDTTGGTNVSPVTGDFSLPYGGPQDVVGYRFTVYTTVVKTYVDKDTTYEYNTAEKAGNSVDIHFKTISGTFKYISARSKKDHITLYREYLDKGIVRCATPTTLSAIAPYYYQFADIAYMFTGTIPSDPTKMDAWFNKTNAETNSIAIAELSEAAYDANYDEDNYYIICEPIFYVTIEGEGHTLTMAELAVYQSRQCGWTDFKGYNTANTYASNIMRFTSAVYGRYLYAVGDYEVFETEPVTSAHLKNDAAGTPSVLLNSSKSNRYNTALDVLKYQVGMGVYTNLPASNEYTVKYDGNGATGGSTASSTHHLNVEEPLTPNGFTKTNHVFAGWATSANGPVVYADKASVKNLTTTNGATVTLYAKWTPISYTVKYDGNGATGGSTASSSHTYGVAKALTANGFTRTGYTFKGWNTAANGSGTSYADKASVKNLTATNGATVTLYAQWTPISYTVKYDGNGATGGSTASSSHTYGVAKALTANGFTRTGYTFKGWNTAANGSGTSYTDKASVSNLTATNGATVTLYAQWTPISYTVTFNANGGTGTMANQSFKWATAQNLLPNAFTYSPVLTYNANGGKVNNASTVVPATFAGWEDRSTTTFNGTTYKYTDFDAPGYALRNNDVFISSYCNSVFDKNGLLNHFVTYGKSEHANGKTYRAPTTGYIYGYPDGAKVSNLTSTNNGTVPLYAKWAFGSTTLPTPTYTGYTFKGWKGNLMDTATFVNGTGVRTADGSFISISNYAATADLIPVVGGTIFTSNYEVCGIYSYDKDGNYIERSSSYTTTHKVPANAAFVRIEVNTSKGVSFEQYQSGLTLTYSLPAGTIFPVGGNQTLVAQWEENTVTVVFHSNGATKLQLVGEEISETHLVDNLSQIFKYSSSYANGLMDGDNPDYLSLTKTGHVFTKYWLVGKANSSTKINQHTVYTGKTLAEAMGQSIDNGSIVVHVYAEWSSGDEGPEIVAVDRWFTLSEALDGSITLEELMSTAEAQDSEVGTFTDFAAGEGEFTIVDYCKEDFTSFKSGGSVTVTYYAKDLTGNEAFKMATIHIVDERAPSPTRPDDQPIRLETRFISSKYYLADDGGFVPEDLGGLKPNSRWVFDNAYVSVLTNVLGNQRIDDVWSVAPVFSFTFDSKKVDEMKNFVETNGLGYSLTDFYNSFLS